MISQSINFFLISPCAVLSCVNLPFQNIAIPFFLYEQFAMDFSLSFEWLALVCLTPKSVHKIQLRKYFPLTIRLFHGNAFNIHIWNIFLLKLFLLRVLCLWHSIGNCHIAFCILFCNLSVCPFTFAYINRLLFYFVTLFSCHHRCPCLDAVDRAQDDHFELEYFCVIIESIFERAYLHQNI